MKDHASSVFKVGDKVKKVILVGYTFPGERRSQQSETIYGEIIFLHDDYAYVKYKGITMQGDDRLTDLLPVSRAEWDYKFKM